MQIVDGASDWGSGDAPPVDPGQPQSHLGRLGERGLDHLRLVQTDAPPLDARQGRRHRHEPV